MCEFHVETQQSRCLRHQGDWGIEECAAISRAIRDERPVCEYDKCELPSQHVDHIVPCWAGGNDDPDNLQALCKLHHSVKTDLEYFQWAMEHGNGAYRPKLVANQAYFQDRPLHPYLRWPSSKRPACLKVRRRRNRG